MICVYVCYRALTILRGTAPVWIGLTKEHNNCADSACLREGWMWADETTYSFQNWAREEPGENDFYACLSDPGWRGINPGINLPFICEYGNTCRQIPTIVVESVLVLLYHFRLIIGKVSGALSPTRLNVLRVNVYQMRV